MEIKIENLSELDLLTKKLASKLRGNELILLNGELAAGKTTFTKHLVKNIDENIENDVNSPTFNVMNVYETSKFTIYHIDLYRVKTFDISDLIDNGLIIVEWANYQNFEDYNIPQIKIDIYIQENYRIFKINPKNADYIKLLLQNK